MIRADKGDSKRSRYSEDNLKRFGLVSARKGVKMTDRRDENNVPFDPKNLNNLPDREIADRNSVYRAAGGDPNDRDLQNLPDREIADRNSVYRLANKKRDKNGLGIEDSEEGQEGQGREYRHQHGLTGIEPADDTQGWESNNLDNNGGQQGNLNSTMQSQQQQPQRGYMARSDEMADNSRSLPYENTNNYNAVDRLATPNGEDRLNNWPDSRTAQGDPNYHDPSNYQNERGSLNKPGSSYSPNLGSTNAGMQKDVLGEHHGPGFSVRRGGANPDDQLGYDQAVEQSWGDKENAIPETVSLDNGEYDGPSKLGNMQPDASQLNSGEQVGFRGSMLDTHQRDPQSFQTNGYPTFEADTGPNNTNDSGYRPA